jgi:transposase
MLDEALDTLNEHDKPVIHSDRGGHYRWRAQTLIPLPSGTKIWLVAGITDMRNGFNGLAAKVQTTLKDDPMSGHVFIFRGRNGSQVKLLWSTGDGLCLHKRLERGRRLAVSPGWQSVPHGTAGDAP